MTTTSLFETDNIIVSVSSGLVMNTWRLLHDVDPNVATNNINKLFSRPDVLKSVSSKLKPGSKLHNIIYSAFQREKIINQFYLDHNFDNLFNEFNYELHHDAVSNGIMKLLTLDDMFTDEQIIKLFDYDLMCNKHIDLILNDYQDSIIITLFDKSRWLKLVPIIGNSWYSNHKNQTRKVKAVMEEYAMWSWENGHSVLASYINNMSDCDLHTFYCQHRNRILANSGLLDEEDKEHDTWSLFLSNKSNNQLLIDNKDNIPVHLRIEYLIQHRLVDALLEYDDMDLVLSRINETNTSLEYIGFWIRLLSKQLWHVQLAIMKK